MSTQLTQEQFRARPSGENPGASFLRDWGGVALAFLVIGLPVTLHLVSPALAIFICVLLGIMVANFATSLAPIVLVFSFVFQNLFVAFVSPGLSSPDDLDAIRAYNFLLTMVVWLVLFTGYWIDRRRFDPRMRQLIDLTTAALALIGAYFCLGATSDLVGAVIYLRNVVTPFVLIQIFALVAYRGPVEFVRPLGVIAGLALAYGYAELIAPEALYRLTNGDDFLKLDLRQAYEAGTFVQQMNETGFVLRSYLDTMVVNILNTPLLSDLNIRITRLVGPNFSSISFAYLLVGMSLVFISTGRWWLGLLMLPLIVVIGSKGALILFMLCTGALFLMRHVPAARRYWLYFAVLCLYGVAGVVIGMRMDDFHVIGFLGGIRGFLANPLGHGLGAGGNLSGNFEQTNWGMAQQVGHTDVGVESSVGVLLYQVGIGAFVLLGVLLWIGYSLWRAYLSSRDPMYAVGSLGLTTLLFNGIFQEEAMFAPLALGFLAGIAGLLLGSRFRTYPASQSEGGVRQHSVARPEPYQRTRTVRFNTQRRDVS